MFKKGGVTIMRLLIGFSLLRAEPEATQESTSVQLIFPKEFGKPTLPIDNKLTKERVSLGEKLFHDTSLSIDGTVS